MESIILFDYDTMRHIWWLLLGVLLIAFAIMDGADLGVAMLLPLVTTTDAERRVLYNVIGPTWEGNQVWLITAGGVIFAAWPLLYAMSFSGFYLAMMLLLVALILRPVAIKYRSKLTSEKWRKNWDITWCLTGLVAALVFGVAIGNVMLGVPFRFDPDTLRPIYEGSFLGLFHPFALLCGLLSIAMLLLQGTTVLSWKTDARIAQAAQRWAVWSGIAVIALFVIAGVWITTGISGYLMDASQLTANDVSNPLAMGKSVNVEAGAWMSVYSVTPLAWITPAVGIAVTALAILLVKHKPLLAVLMSSLSIAAIIFTFGFSTYPFLLPSSLDPSSSLTIYDASASHLTLWVMLLVTIVFLPLIIAYTSWVFRVMRGKVTPETVNDAPHAY